ncbi:MAG: homoserine O-acetyltransferase [Bacteroidota bacterium]
METRRFVHSEPFFLESGTQLPGFELSYTISHPSSQSFRRRIWVCHALTANSEPVEWWPGLVGKGCVIDPEKDQIVCANMLGSCYGSTNALSLDPTSQKPWFHQFPVLTNRDIVRAFDLLRLSLKMDHIDLLIGGSMGGQQCLEWAIQAPSVFGQLVPLATNAVHSPWGIAFNESQRMAIAADQSWQTAHPDAGKEGLEAARAIALLSYRNYQTYQNTQQDPDDGALDDFRASSYQRYQGQKLRKRFHAFSYWTLSKAMDSHNVARGRYSLAAALGNITAKTLVIGVESDVLFPPTEQKRIAQHIADAQYVEIASTYGHDGFLIEVGQIEQILTDFLETS